MNKTFHNALMFALLSAFPAATAQFAPAQTETVLYSFTGADGRFPYARLIRNAQGNIFGTTLAGGVDNYGTVFELTNGAETVLYNFTGGTDGSLPEADLIFDSHGNAFGTTASGGPGGPFAGYGTVFKISSARKEKVLYTFCSLPNCTDGATPQSGLLRDKAGNLYGTTVGGGSYGYGTVFELSASGIETVLHSFAGGSDGATPYAGLVRDSKGNFYGTTNYGGAFNKGTVFEVAADGSEKVLYSFTGGADGSNPQANLLLGAKGDLYGTTYLGGAYGNGTVFKLTSAGVETVLHSFAGGSDGALPSAGLVRDPKGNFYGTTSYGGGGVNCPYGSGCGTVFKVTKKGTETVLHVFNSFLDGAVPLAALTRDAKTGDLYGTTHEGGDPHCNDNLGCGTIFKVTP